MKKTHEAVNACESQCQQAHTQFMEIAWALRRIGMTDLAYEIESAAGDVLIAAKNATSAVGSDLTAYVSDTDRAYVNTVKTALRFG